MPYPSLLAISDTSVMLASIIGSVALLAVGGGLYGLARRQHRLEIKAFEERAEVAETEAKLSAAELEVVSAKIAYLEAEADLHRHAAEQSENFSAAIIESATVIMIGVDDEGHLRVFNRTAESVTGYSREELMEIDWMEVLFPGEIFEPARTALTALVRKELNHSIETLLIAKGGEEKQIAWGCRHVLYQNEAIALMFGVDLTERALAEQERHDLERKLLDMQKLESLGVLAGGIAHDFNNLLTAILGNSQLAKLQTSRSSPVYQYLMEVERTSLQAADLCKQMLAYSGQGKIETRLLDLNQILREMSQLLRISVDRKVHLSFDLAHNLPLILGDASQIRQVLMNLIINASEAIGNREGSIWVSSGIVHGARNLFRGTAVTGEPEERDYVFISVTDTGCGMSEETKARIFDPFFTTKFTGRGLGLAAVLGIVRGHSGTLELTSKEGEGTTFTLLFPKAEPNVETEGEDEYQPQPHWSGEGLILVVDDEESVRTLTSRMVESFDFHVIDAADGREAVEKFEIHCDAITAVLLDVTMPVMSGLEAFKRIREIRPNVPVLFLSGYMREGELRTLSGATDFLHKPFKIDDLQEKLRILLTPSVEA